MMGFIRCGAMLLKKTLSKKLKKVVDILRMLRYTVEVA